MFSLRLCSVYGSGLFSLRLCSVFGYVLSTVPGCVKRVVQSTVMFSLRLYSVFGSRLFSLRSCSVYCFRFFSVFGYVLSTVSVFSVYNYVISTVMFCLWYVMFTVPGCSVYEKKSPNQHESVQCGWHHKQNWEKSSFPVSLLILTLHLRILLKQPGLCRPCSLSSGARGPG